MQLTCTHRFTEKSAYIDILRTQHPTTSIHLTIHCKNCEKIVTLYISLFHSFSPSYYEHHG